MLIMFLSKYPIQIKRVTERLELSKLRMRLMRVRRAVHFRTHGSILVFSFVLVSYLEAVILRSDGY